jgi:tetratricopeptide (TPR) repeat protein
MTPLAQIPAIRQLIGEGNLELALAQLVAVLDSDPRYAELAQIARVNQADLYQNKSAILKGTISTEDARLASNQIADNVLSLLGQLEKGQLSPAAGGAAPTRSQAWRYYTAGGIVTLALAILAWRFFGGGLFASGDACPEFGDNYAMKVMVLPFKQSGGGEAGGEPEFDISDGLNRLLGEAPGIRGIADVNESYDIEQNYPSPAEAADLARQCDAQMIVWGRINRNAQDRYKLDVFYKLLDATGVRLSGDTTLSNLLRMRETGQLQLVEDVNAVVRLLFVVLANKTGQPIAEDFMQKHLHSGLATTALSAQDTAMTLALAYNLAQNGQKTTAIEAYTSLLEAYPYHQEAREKRGALLYETGDYAAAAFDLGIAAPENTATDDALLKVRLEAELKSGQPERAQKSLDALGSAKAADDRLWVRQKKQEISDSLSALQALRDKKEKMAQKQPRNQKANIEAARLNYNLGDNEDALKFSNKVIRQNPKAPEAWELKAKALAEKGDSAALQQTIRAAEQQGVNVKTIPLKAPPSVKPLKTNDGG